MHYETQGISENSYPRQRQQDHEQREDERTVRCSVLVQDARGQSCSPTAEEVISAAAETGTETIGSLEEVRFTGNGSPSELEDGPRMSRYREELGTKRPSFSKQQEHQSTNFFQHSENTSVKCFPEEMVSVVANHYRGSSNSPDRTSPLQGYPIHSTDRRNTSFGKTSFCIDALLGRATGKQESVDHDRSGRNQRLLFASRSLTVDGSHSLGNSFVHVHERQSPCTLGTGAETEGETEAGTETGTGTGTATGTETETGTGTECGSSGGNGDGIDAAAATRRVDGTVEHRTSCSGSLLNPFDRAVLRDPDSPSFGFLHDGSGRENFRDRATLNIRSSNIRVEPVEAMNTVSIQRGKSMFRGESIGNGNEGFRVDRLENIEDDGSVEVDATRTGSASSGSNASHSPVSSPPISPGSEEPIGNGVAGNPNLAAGHYGALAAGTGVTRQNQALLLHPSGPLIHPSGLYYHPAGGSAFHSIHKEGQPVGHTQTAGPHPQQHHIHPLQLEWLARTGMLYPRLPADLAGEYQLFNNCFTFRNECFSLRLYPHRYPPYAFHR